MLHPVRGHAVGMNLGARDTHMNLHDHAESAFLGITQHRDMTVADAIV